MKSHLLVTSFSVFLLEGKTAKDFSFVLEAGLNKLSIVRLVSLAVYCQLYVPASASRVPIGPGDDPVVSGGGAVGETRSGLGGVKARGGPHRPGGWAVKGESFRR